MVYNGNGKINIMCLGVVKQGLCESVYWLHVFPFTVTITLCPDICIRHSLNGILSTFITVTSLLAFYIPTFMFRFVQHTL